jgi:O-antigen chain-terminating methyltransferase
LHVNEADALEALRTFDDGVLGAVTAYHMLEHLPADVLLNLVSEVHRVLKPGGVFWVECPNPHNLRVGAALFWIDPTHLRPLMPETLDLALKSCGFEVPPVEFRHPFDDNELFSQPEWDEGPVDDRLDRLERRLDELLNGPRDFLITARKPGDGRAEVGV